MTAFLIIVIVLLLFGVLVPPVWQEGGREGFLLGTLRPCIGLYAFPCGSLFGVLGAVIKGVLWLALIGVAVIVASSVFGWFRLRAEH